MSVASRLAGWRAQLITPQRSLPLMENFERSQRRGPRPRATALLAVSAVLLGAPAARAEDERLDDLDLVKLLNVEVSTATKTSESLDDAPAIIQVVTQADIRRWGYQTVAEVLDHIQGFYLFDDHIIPNAAVRGMSGGLGAESGVIKVMIDGRSVAYRTTSGNWLGTELIPMESIAQIEIIRGPASALYGADAFLGVVNIITIRPDDLGRVRGRAAVGPTGDHLGTRLDVAGGARLGKWYLQLGAAGEVTDRSGLMLPAESPAPILPGDIMDPGSRRTANNLQRKSLSLQAQGGYIDERLGRLGVSAYVSALERGGDFAHWAQLTNRVDALGQQVGTVIALGQYRLNLDGLLHVSHTVDLALAATYFQGGVLPQDRIDVASDLYYFERHQSYRGVDSTFEARWTPLARFNAIVGVETVFDHEKLEQADRIDLATGQPLDQAAPATIANLLNVGTYTSLNLKVLDPWLKMTGGVRYDHHNVYGGQTSGRLGLTSRLHPTLVQKLLYGSAFKAPSPYLLYATPLRPGDVIGNRDLRPMHIHTVEYQLSWKPRPFIGITSGVSYNWLLDEAAFTLQGINQAARNVASQRTFTWETRADVRLSDGFVGYASFDLVESTRDTGQQGYAASLVGSKNVAYPPWIARAGLSVALPSPTKLPLSACAETILVSKRRADDTSIVEHGSEFYLPLYDRLDACLTTGDLYLIRGQETRIALRGRNLLGAFGPDPGPSGIEYPLAPREILLEIRHMY
jgi:iron complex outermembrane receptor protein